MEGSDIYKGGVAGADGTSPEDMPLPEKKPRSGWWAVLAGVLAFWLMLVVMQGTSWTNWRMGLLVGAMVGGMFAPFFLIYLLPWVGLFAILYQWRKWRRFRLLWMMLPALLFSAMTVWMLVAAAVHPPDARDVFRQRMEVEMPGNARDVRWYLSGGLAADHHDAFSFETTPEEVERLVAGMKLERAGNWEPGRYQDMKPRGMTWYPDHKTWEGGQLYEGHDDDENAFYHFYVDAERKRVLVMRLTI